MSWNHVGLGGYNFSTVSIEQLSSTTPTPPTSQVGSNGELITTSTLQNSQLIKVSATIPASTTQRIELFEPVQHMSTYVIRGTASALTDVTSVQGVIVHGYGELTGSFTLPSYSEISTEDGSSNCVIYTSTTIVNNKISINVENYKNTALTCIFTIQT